MSVSVRLVIKRCQCEIPKYIDINISMENTDIGHWECKFQFNPDEWFGFIYRIIEISTGREYIGKKQFTKTKRKKIKGRKNRKHIKSSSNWKEYTSSSDHINEAIQINSMANYRFVIESLHKTKGSLHYAEVRAQILEDVLRTKLSDGTRKYFNKQVNAVRYLPPDENNEEILHRSINYASSANDPMKTL